MSVIKWSVSLIGEVYVINVQRRRMKMAYKKHTFPKLGRKFHQLGKKKKGGLPPAEWQKKRQEIIKKNPLW